MKLIHIISSVVIFSLSVLATNDWDCGGNTVYAYTIDREMFYSFHHECKTFNLFYVNIPQHQIFEAEFEIPGSNPPGAKFKLQFNRDFVIGHFIYKIDDEAYYCTQLSTSTTASD
ncbi:putative candidate secreted effector protein [Blumeria hordei DH14]|uniref:Putative candidate secreted effector protein n=1 Tax=Blumeria graminis f. sp. hordei (strain DH14) TaxID=546991 RepID=N1JRG8_BLUG1|nr:putative candidate secreted effector protein [Blumeria hordei DH14]